MTSSDRNVSDHACDFFADSLKGFSGENSFLRGVKDYRKKTNNSEINWTTNSLVLSIKPLTDH